jgi:hypothetical protein
VASQDDLNFASLARRALDDGYTAVKNGNPRLAEQSFAYAYDCSSKIGDAAIGQPLLGECAHLRAMIDAVTPEEVAMRAALRGSEVAAYEADMIALREEQERTGALAEDQRALQDVKDYGAVGSLFAGAARTASRKIEEAADAYSTQLYLGAGLVALVAGAAIVWKVA